MSSGGWTKKMGKFNKAKISHLLNDKTNVTIGNQNYEFDLKENQMFYFVIVREKNGERYVERN